MNTFIRFFFTGVHLIAFIIIDSIDTCLTESYRKWNQGICNSGCFWREEQVKLRTGVGRGLNFKNRFIIAVVFQSLVQETILLSQKHYVSHGTHANGGQRALNSPEWRFDSFSCFMATDIREISFHSGGDLALRRY